MIRDTVGCWVNPPALSVAISINAELIVSIVMTIISIIITIIFAILKFDCITDVTQEILDAIRQVFTGIIGGIELGATIGKQGKEAAKQAKLTQAFLKEKKANKKKQDAKKVTMNMNAEVLQEIINTGIESTEKVLSTFGVNPSDMLQQGLSDLDDMTTKQSELLKTLGLSNSISPSSLASSAMSAVKQMISITDAADGDSKFQVVGLEKTKKKIVDNANRFLALLKTPYEKAKAAGKAVKDAAGV
jgi:hypothetical protein